jgi:hypothetical protein
MAALPEGEMGSVTLDGDEALGLASTSATASTSPAAKASTKASINHRVSIQAQSKANPNAKTNSHEIPGTTDYIVIVDNQPPKVQVMSSSEPLGNVKPKDISADCVDVVSSVGELFCCGGNRKKVKKERKVNKGATKMCVLL